MRSEETELSQRDWNAARKSVSEPVPTKVMRLAECSRHPTTRAEYRAWCLNNRSNIRRVADSISFPAIREQEIEWGRRAGDIDESKLVTFSHPDLKTDRIFGKRDETAIKRRKMVILLDMSGSMSGSKLHEASEIVRLLVEGFRELHLDHTQLHVWGHTGDGCGYGDHVRLVKILVDGVDEMEHTLHCHHSSMLGNNYDGQAIHEVLQRECADGTDPSDMTLLVISDGRPSANGMGYGRCQVGMAHTRLMVDEWTNKGVRVYGIGILNAFSQSTANLLYGRGNCKVLPDVASGLNLLCEAIRESLMLSAFQDVG